MRFRSLPIFWQTLLLLLAGLTAAQIISVLLIISLPAPPPEAVTLTEISDALSGTQSVGERLNVVVSDRPPVRDDTLIENPSITFRLAAGLGRSASEVRLFYAADQSANFPFGLWGGKGTPPVRHGQPYFFNRLVAAERQSPSRWRIVRTSHAPIISAWQARTSLWFAVSALAMLPFAWIFARRLTRPIRRLAEAVGMLGDDPDAPAVPTDGPAELQLTAIALNDMQERIRANMRERAAMMGAIAHDLRTPLARIAFRVEATPEAVRNSVLQDIEQIHAMVAATVAYLRGETGNGDRTALDLANLVDVAAIRLAEVGWSVRVTNTVSVIVSGDRLALERLVQNLVENAIKYAGAAELAVEKQGDCALLSVSDSGPGIPEQDIERMFEPFERREPSRNRQTGGVGLGLSIARTIAHAHKGTIKAFNRAEGGLRIVVELPTLVTRTGSAEVVRET